MHEIDCNTAALAAAVEQQNVATGEISHNMAGAARGTAHVLGVPDDVSNAASETRASAETVRNASQSVESAVANLRASRSRISCKVGV
jgi:methyl-accepting chemotaxis protein